MNWATKARAIKRVSELPAHSSVRSIYTGGCATIGVEIGRDAVRLWTTNGVALLEVDFANYGGGNEEEESKHVVAVTSRDLSYIIKVVGKESIVKWSVKDGNVLVSPVFNSRGGSASVSCNVPIPPRVPNGSLSVSFAVKVSAGKIRAWAKHLSEIASGVFINSRGKGYIPGIDLDIPVIDNTLVHGERCVCVDVGCLCALVSMVHDSGDVTIGFGEHKIRVTSVVGDGWIADRPVRFLEPKRGES